MQHHLSVLFMAALLSFPMKANAQTPRHVINYLSIQGPVVLQKNSYALIWSSHPEASLFKQEYLTSGDAFPRYKSMLTIDFVITEATIDQAVARKIRELQTLKKTNHEVNFEVIANAATGEKIIDCLIGQTAADEKNSLIEHDIFRYKSVKAKSGQRGVLLLAVSTRKYGNEIRPFLIKLKNEKAALVREVASLPLPALQISKQY